MNNKMPNYGLMLGLSIAELILCNLLFGILGIVFVTGANTAFMNGDYMTADQKKRTATILLIVGAVIGLIVNAINIIRYLNN